MPVYEGPQEQRHRGNGSSLASGGLKSRCVSGRIRQLDQGRQEGVSVKGILQKSILSRKGS